MIGKRAWPEIDDYEPECLFVQQIKFNSIQFNLNLFKHKIRHKDNHIIQIT